MTMTKEQKEVLIAWCKNLLVTYRIDYFRGRAVWAIVTAIWCRSRWNLYVATSYCQDAKNLGFNANTKDYTELLKELRQIAKEVPLSDNAQSAIACAFGGDWKEAIDAIEELRSERNEQN